MQPHEEAESRPPVEPRAPRTPPPNPVDDADPELLRAIVGSVRDYAIFALDPGGHIATWSPGAEAIKGWRAEEIVGEAIAGRLPERDPAPTRRPARQ